MIRLSRNATEIDFRDPEFGDVWTQRSSVIERNNVLGHVRQCEHDTPQQWRELEFKFSGLIEATRALLNSFYTNNKGHVVTMRFMPLGLPDDEDRIINGIMKEFQEVTERDGCSYAISFKLETVTVE